MLVTPFPGDGRPAIRSIKESVKSVCQPILLVPASANWVPSNVRIPPRTDKRIVGIIVQEIKAEFKRMRRHASSSRRRQFGSWWQRAPPAPFCSPRFAEPPCHERKLGILGVRNAEGPFQYRFQEFRSFPAPLPYFNPNRCGIHVRRRGLFWN